MRKIISALLVMITVLGMLPAGVLAASSLEEAMEEVNIYAKNEDLDWLTMNGAVKIQHYTYYLYQSPQTGELAQIPAYCVDPRLYGVPALVPEGDYKDWFDGNILWSYFESEYPWTRLGYTYDWSGGEREYGLTEFLLRDAGDSEVVFTDTTAAFVARLAEWAEKR